METKIGSKLWLDNGDGKLKEVTVSKISIFDFQDPQIRLKDKNNKYYFFRIDDLGFIDKYLFWEKPIKYQLPDTEGNLSEVKIEQHVWVSYKNGNVYEVVISGFNNDHIEIMFICDNGKLLISNKEGLTHSGGRVTTNKPHRDFSDCPHWEENLNAKYWGVDKKGESYFYEAKPTAILYYGYFVGWASDKHAGFRADLLNEDGIVEDWEYSLVKRPEGK